jgi:hypothetical protein
MEKIKLFTDTERLRIERGCLFRAIDCANKVRDFLSGVGITPTMDKITGFIFDQGKEIIDELNSDTEDNLMRISSEITKTRLKKDVAGIIATIEDFVKNTAGFVEFDENKHLISINPKTLEVKLRYGYDKELEERCTHYVTDFDKYAEFKDVADKINQLAAKYEISVIMDRIFSVVNGQCIPDPIFNKF